MKLDDYHLIQARAKLREALQWWTDYERNVLRDDQSSSAELIRSLLRQLRHALTRLEEACDAAELLDERSSFDDITRSRHLVEAATAVLTDDVLAQLDVALLEHEQRASTEDPPDGADQ